MNSNPELDDEPDNMSNEVNEGSISNQEEEEEEDAETVRESFRIPDVDLNNLRAED